jgi:hypothetical protein
MLTVDKLVKTMAYEEKRKKEKDEKRKLEMSKIELFNNIENEDEWNLKKQETQEKRKKDMENHIIKLQNKRNESIEQLEKYKKEKQMSLPIFNHITNENAWKQERNRLKIKRNKEHQQRMLNKEEANEIKNKELQKKITEYREQLQKQHDARSKRHAFLHQNEMDRQNNHTNLINWYNKEKENQLKRLEQRERNTK